MSAGVFRGVAVQDIRSGDEVEVTVGQRVVVAKLRPAAVKAPWCWKGSLHARTCLGQQMWRVERIAWQVEQLAMSGWACSAHLAELVQAFQKTDGGGDVVVRPAELAS